MAFYFWYFTITKNNMSVERIARSNKMLVYNKNNHYYPLKILLLSTYDRFDDIDNQELI